MTKDKIKHHKKAEHHTKEKKPKKEKKERDKITAAQRVKKPKGIQQTEKPKGIQQTEKQKQIVNIQINNGGGGGDEEKKKKISLPIPMPNIVFNPSLSFQPNAYPITKPETNPPYFETPMIHNFNIPEQAPPIMINNNIEKPKANKPIIINKNDIKPEERVPVQPYQPIPQDDVSRPKEQIPELFIGNETIKTKHDLHKEQMKQIKPINQPIIIPKKPKIKDTEGLGTNIPISKIGELAGTIIAGGLTGGAVAGTEGLLMGGLSSEALQSAFLGGSIGAGVNEAVGGGPIGHYISSVAGGLASRVSQRNTTQQNRPSQDTSRISTLDTDTNEPPPLVPFTGGGNRLGGTRLTGDDVVSRRINSVLSRNQRSIQQDINDISDQIPQSAENTQPRELPRSILRPNDEFDELMREDINDISDQIPQNTQPRELPRIIIRPNQEFDELMREVNEEQGAKATLKAAMKRRQAQEKFRAQSTKELIDPRNEPQTPQTPQTPLSKYIQGLKQKYGTSNISQDEGDIVYRDPAKRRQSKVILNTPPSIEATDSAIKIQRAVRKIQAKNQAINQATKTLQAAARRATNNEIQTRKKSATTLQAAARRAIDNPDIQARELVNETIKQLEYETRGRQKARQLLQTMQPSTDLSTSTSALGGVPRAPRSPIKTIDEQLEERRQRNRALFKQKVQDPAATRIQSAIRNRNARHELDKSVEARVQRMTDELTRSQGNMDQLLNEGQNVISNIKGKRASTLQAAIRRRQQQEQFRAQQNMATLVGAQTRKRLTNKAQIKRFETEMSDLDKPAARESTRIRRDERRPIVESGLNILRKNQIKQAPGRPRTRSGAVDDKTIGTNYSTASTFAGGFGPAFTPKKMP